MELKALSLKELANLVNIPSILKMSKEKAVARVQKELAKKVEASIQHDDVALTAKPEESKAAPAISHGLNKHAKLLEALAAPSTREVLMEASGFDAKNLSVALCNLKNKGVAIKIEVKDGVRLYSVVEDSSIDVTKLVTKRASKTSAAAAEPVWPFNPDGTAKVKA